MNAHIVDCRGMACPQPVLETKKALEGGHEKVLVIVDNGAARENVSRFAGRAGFKVAVEEKEGCYHLLISGRVGEVTAAGSAGEETAGCGAAPAGAVYFITTSAIGQGSPDLGAVLMKSLMTTLAGERPPRAMLFLNTGVQLAVEGSPVLEQLRKLAGAGTEILVCGTCLDYYRLREKLAVGTVSNMYEINSRLTGPDKVITVA